MREFFRRITGAAAMMAALSLIANNALAEVAPAPDQASKGEVSMNVKKLTPVLLTDEINACIEFWKSFGLEATALVPGPDNNPMFAILSNGVVEVMYQTFASAKADDAAAVEGVNRAILFFEVEALDKIIPAVRDYEIVKPVHSTDYGSREIYIRDPAGNLIGFAQQQAAGQDEKNEP